MYMEFYQNIKKDSSEWVNVQFATKYKNGCDEGRLLKEPKLHWIKMYVPKIKLQGVYFRMREVNEMLNYTCLLMINIVHELNILIVFTFNSVFSPFPVN